MLNLMQEKQQRKNKKIDKEDIKQVATSEKALRAISESLSDIKTCMQSTQKEDNTKEQ